jgi:hypothetical protein
VWIILRTIDKKVRRDIQLQFYKCMVIPVLMCGCKVWAMTATDWQQLQSAEINFLLRVKKYSLKDHLKNASIKDHRCK